jgi:PTS system nitrogen regulatory IIA component
MRISQLLSPDRIRIPLLASDKEGVLRELVDLMMQDNGGREGGAAAGGAGGSRAEVMNAILERERQFPTGIGYGVAVPHGKAPSLSTLQAVAGTARTAVPYETIDGEPVRLFFMRAGPESLAGEHVKAIGRISRIVRREPVRSRLLAATTPAEFYRVLCDAEAT